MCRRDCEQCVQKRMSDNHMTVPLWMGHLKWQQKFAENQNHYLLHQMNESCLNNLNYANVFFTTYIYLIYLLLPQK